MAQGGLRAAVAGLTARVSAGHDIVWDDAKIARLWDHHAAVGAGYFSEKHGEQILRAARIPLHQPLRVLDFGCGPGFLWDHLRRLGSRWIYTGLDLSEAGLARLDHRAAGSPDFAGTHLLKQLPTGLEPGNYDLVLLIEVVEHLDDERLDQTLREAARLLRPGGQLLITTPNNEDLAASTHFCPDCGARFHQWQHVRSWTTASLARALAPYGFAEIESQAVNLTVAGHVRRTIDRLRRRLRGQPMPHLVALFAKDSPAI